MKEKEGRVPYQNVFESAPLSLWVEDFTRARQALDALTRRGVKNFRDFFDRHPEELIKISRHVRVLEVTPFTLKLFKAPTARALLKDLDKTFTEDTLPPFKREILALAEGKQAIEFETTRRTLDGKPFPCEVLWTLLHNNDCSECLALVALRDISGPKNVEQALAESEALYRALVEQSLVGVYLFGKDRFHYVNEALADMMGYPTREIIEHLRPIDLIHPDDRAYAQEKMRGRLEGKRETERYTFRGLRKDGKDLYCEVFGRGITYKNRPAILGTIIDITEKTSMEKILREQMASLSFLNDIGKIFVSANSIETVTKRVLPLIREATRADIALLYRHSKGHLSLLGTSPESIAPSHLQQIKDSVCLCGKAMAGREALYVNNISEDERSELNFCKEIGIAAFAALPLTSGDHDVGLLGLGWKEEIPLKKVRSFYEAIGDYLSLGLQNTLLFAETKRQARELVEKVRERTQELQQMVNLMAGREIRMIELKGIIRQLREQIRELGAVPVAKDPLDGEPS